jgi:hypothetical protein
MDIGAAFVADGQTAVAVHPGMGAFNHPAVPTKASAALDPTPGDPGHDAAGLALLAAASVIVAFVGMQLIWPLSRTAHPTPDRWDRIQRRCQHPAIMLVCGSDQEAKRRAASVGDEMTLRARLATIRGVRPGRRPPLFAATDTLSSEARRQSICPAACSCSSRTRCRPAQIPASCQSRNRRRQLIPDPQPISVGSISQGKPERSTNRIPVSAARSGRRGRPPFG